jgi:hypothetical protein
MKPLTDQEESDFVNGYLDRTLDHYRSTLRDVGEGKLTAAAGAGILAALIGRGLADLDTDATNSVGMSLAYELSQSIRCEINGGIPYRLDRPRTMMMRTPLTENALEAHGYREPLLHFVSVSFFYLGRGKSRDELVSRSLEARGADVIDAYLDSLDIWDEVLE